MTPDDTIKRRALRLLRAGRVNLSEAAHLAGVSRQLMRHWASRAGIDPIAARLALLRRYWRRCNKS